MQLETRTYQNPSKLSISILMKQPPHQSTLFPYTTLFRSVTFRRVIRTNHKKASKSWRLFYGSDRKSGSAGMPRPISYAVFCLKKKNNYRADGQIAERRIGIGRERVDPLIGMLRFFPTRLI